MNLGDFFASVECGPYSARSSCMRDEVQGHQGDMACLNLTVSLGKHEERPTRSEVKFLSVEVLVY